MQKIRLNKKSAGRTWEVNFGYVEEGIKKNALGELNQQARPTNSLIIWLIVKKLQGLLFSQVSAVLRVLLQAQLPPQEEGRHEAEEKTKEGKEEKWDGEEGGQY